MFWVRDLSFGGFISIKSGKNVLVAAHGNSLRALVKHLDDISDEKITGLNIPTGIPLVCLYRYCTFTYDTSCYERFLRVLTLEGQSALLCESECVTLWVSL